jgi:membrane protein YdbS with pleckstrin-like domain
MENIFHFVETYFTEEKIESLFFIIIGSIAILLASFFLLVIRYSFFKGMAIPFLIVGVIQLSVGISVYSRAEKDIERVNYFTKQEPKKIQTQEVPRMEKVMKNFTIYKWIEIILVIVSIILLIIFYSSPQTYWKGLALGLIIQAVTMLNLDVLAQKRGRIYLEKLQEINKQ